MLPQSQLVRVFQLRPELLSFFGCWWVQSTLVIAAGLAVAYWLRRRGPALQSAIYRATLVAALVCPLAGALLSAAGIGIPNVVLPHIRAVAIDDVVVAIPQTRPIAPPQPISPPHKDILPMPQIALPPEVADRPPTGFDTDRDLDARMQRSNTFAPSATSDVRRAEPAPPPKAVAPPPVAKPLPPLPPLLVHRSVWAVHWLPATAIAAVLAIWLLGTLALSTRLAMSLFRLLALYRSATPAVEDRQHLCRELSRQLGVRPPRLLQSPFVAGPCLAGFYRATIFLPEESFDLPLAAVLVHELAHLRRGDCRWNLIRQASLAVLFWQPLVWRLSRRMETVAEEVCDDHVVHWGGDPTVYASGLVRLAEQRTLPISTVVPLVTFRSLLGQRVQRILDNSRRLSLRTGVKALCAIAVTGLAVTLLVGAFGSGRPEVAAAPRSTIAIGDSKSKVAKATDSKNEQVSRSTKAIPVVAGSSLHIRGTVVDLDGKPVAGAKIFVTTFLVGTDPFTKVGSEGVANGDGTFEFTVNPSELGAVRSTWIDSRILAAADGFGVALGDSLDFDTTGIARKLNASGSGLSQDDREFLSGHLGEKPHVLRLAKDDQPLAGRIVSLEGRPIAGATIALYRVQTGKSGNLDLWQQAADKPKPDLRALATALDFGETTPQLANVITPVATDRDGRFTMRGIGRERIVALIVSGRGIETRVIRARTRAGKSFTVPGNFFEPPEVYYANGFTHAAGPSNDVVGRVTDRATGKPLARVTVLCQKLSGDPLHSSGEDYTRTVTDANGRYRLEGLPLGDNEVGAYILDQPYLATTKRVRIDVGSKPTTLDFPLARGIWAEGRATDKRTGLPIAGSVKYYAFNSNPALKKAGGLRPVYPDEFGHRTDASGRYRIAVLPGPGIVGFAADDYTTYAIRGVGGDKIPGGRTNSGTLMFGAEPSWCDAEDFNLVAEINPPENAHAVNLDFTVENGSTVVGRLVDSRGKPIMGAMYYGSDTDPGYGPCEPTSGDSFQVNSYDASKPRRLVFYEPSRNLAAVCILKGQPPNPLVVRLDPAGAVRGRLVNEHGTTLAGLEIGRQAPPYHKLTTLPVADLPLPIPPNRPNNDWPTTDDGGNFIIHGLIPGRSYNVWVSDEKKHTFEGKFSHRFSAKAGELKDLGDVTLKPSLDDDAPPTGEANSMSKSAGTTPKAKQNNPPTKTNSASSTAQPSNASPLQIRGQVVDPSGKPVARARLFVTYGFNGVDPHDVVRPWGAADAEGWFEFSIKRSELGLKDDFDWLDAHLVAKADGYGVALGDLLDFDTSGFAKKLSETSAGSSLIYRDRLAPHLVERLRLLRLASDDSPLMGRIVSLEGKPVAGAWIALHSISSRPQTSNAVGGFAVMEEAMAAANRQSAKKSAAAKNSQPSIEPFFEEGENLSQIIPAATTDADGRFTFRGIGHDREAGLLVSGKGIETSVVKASPDDGKKTIDTQDIYGQKVTTTFYTNNFTHAAGPSTPVVGRVTDRDTGKPLAGVTVMTRLVQGHSRYESDLNYIRTVTDADGRYRIEGLPIGRGNVLYAYALDQPYIPREENVRVEPQSEPITRDFKLIRGIWVEGQATDKNTGEPVDGVAAYHVFLSNPLWKQAGEGWWLTPTPCWTQATDGRFRVAALPGRGIVTFTARDWGKYGVVGLGSEKIAGAVEKFGGIVFETETFIGPRSATAMAEVNPPKDADSVHLDFSIDGGSTVAGHITDGAGKPVLGTSYYDEGPLSTGWAAAKGDSFEIRSYMPDRPRRVVFFEPKQNLAGVFLLKGVPPKSLVVQLKRAGTVRGRLVDASGSPMANKVLVRRTVLEPEQMKSPPDAWPLPLAPVNTTTGPDGRFEIPGLVPGKKYEIVAMNLGGRYEIAGQLSKPIAAESGQTTDIGDVRIEPINPERSFEKPTAKQIDAANVKKATAMSGGAMPAAATTPAGNQQAVPAKPNDFILQHVAGTVLAPDGKPAVGASVILSGFVVQPPRRFPIGIQELQIPDPADDGLAIIGRAQCDAAGHFEIAGPANVRYNFANLLVRAAGTALAWQQIDPKKPDADCTIKLLKSAPLRMRLVGLEGKPVAGIRVTVTSIFRNPNTPNYSGVFRSPSLPADLWPSAVTDADGWFSISALAAGVQAEVSINQEPYAPDGWRLEPAGEKPKKQVHILVPGQVIKGIVVAADSGKPLAGETVLASEGGEFQTVGTAKSDSQGRFRINAGTGSRFQVAAFGPANGAYTPRQIAFDWRATEREHEVRFELPPGVRINGTLVEEPGGQPIARAAVVYYLGASAPAGTDIHLQYGGPFDPTDDRYHPAEVTDEHGRFSILVPTGRGKLAVWAAGDFVQYDSAWGNAVVPLDLPASPRETKLQIPLQRAVTIKGRVVRADGQSINQTWKGRLESSSWPGHEPALVRMAMNRDQFEITGFPPDGEMLATFGDSGQGKLFPIRGSDAGKPLELRLEPCGSLALQFVDRKGKPLVGLWPTLLASLPPAKAGTVHWSTSSWYPPADNRSKQFPDGRTDESGRLTFVNLIPGLAYGLWMPNTASKNPSAVKIQEIVVKPGERLELPPMTVRRPNEFSPGGIVPQKPANKTASAAAVNTLQTTGNRQNRTAATHENAAATPPAHPSPTASATNTAAPLEIRGQVVDPNGKPVGGAKVFVVRWYSGATRPAKVKPLFTTGADGQFQFHANVFDPKTGSGDYPLDAEIAATADRFGLAFDFLADFDTSGNAERLQAAKVPGRRSRPIGDKSRTLHLVADDVPLTGRIISIEGRPVVGARVALSELWLNKDGNLDAWENAAKLPHADALSLRSRLGYVINSDSLPGIIPAVMTDSSGRFTMHGLGRERLATLLVSGPGIETKFFDARTRRGATIVIKRNNENDDNKEILASDLVHVAGPSNAIVGRVTDRATGKPLAGVTVLSQALQGNPIRGWGQDFIRATTDADGRYRLEGMPVGNGNEIGAFTLAEPYIPVSKNVRINVGAKPVMLNFKMPRGVWVEGQVSDELTHAPIPSSVEYLSLQSNPFYKRLGSVGYVDMRDFQHSTADGRFRIAVLPGQGIVTVSADEFEKYPMRGLGQEKVPGFDAKSGFFKTAPIMLIPANCSALAAVNPAADAKVVNLSFALPTGGRIVGHLVDADGKPIFGASFCGKEELEYWSATDADSFTVVAYKPDKPRRLIFYKPKKNLAAMFVLSGTPAKPPVVGLTPAGAATGRLLDEFGRPIRQARLGCFIRAAGAKMTPPTNEEGFPLAPTGENRFGPMTDDDGHFEIRGLITGQTYNFSAYKIARFVGRFPEPVTVSAGETKNLGDVVAKPDYFTEDTTTNPHRDATADSSTKPANAAKLQTTAPTSPGATRGDLIRIRGTVVDPGGKPVAGAIVHGLLWVHQPQGGSWHDATPPMETKSDSAGRFTLECRKSELVPNDPRFHISIQISALLPDGQFGPEWTDYDPRKPHDLRLQLVPDEPIEGRIIDLEGKPVAGADVSAWISKNSQNDLSQWLAALKTGLPLQGSDGAGRPDEMYLTTMRKDFAATTDSAGRFRLAGVGRDRLARIKVSARGFVSDDLSAATRPMEPLKIETRARRSSEPHDFELIYGARFTAVLEPEQSIEGYVRDASTGKPIADVHVSGSGYTNSLTRSENQNTSDREGHYRINGLQPGDTYELWVDNPAGQPYFGEVITVPKPARPGTIGFDLALHRGVLIHGRITNKQTGQPVRRADVQYVPSLNNPHVAAMPEPPKHRPRWLSKDSTDEDGRFTLTGFPGRGLIEVAECREHVFPVRQGFSNIRDLAEFDLRPWSDSIAVKEMRIDENEAEAKCEIQLEPAKPLELKLVDPQGAPLDQVEICGANEPSLGYRQASAGSTARILGLGANEQRTVVFRQTERKLGRVVIISWKKFGPGPATLALEPCATIKLRLVDAEHQPLRGIQMTFIPTHEGDNSNDSTGLFQREVTDSDGRLTFPLLAPGNTYKIASELDGLLGNDPLVEALAVESGTTIDLGDIDDSKAKHGAKPKAKPAAKKAATALKGSAQSQQTTTELIRVRGRVLDPQGKPVAGAEVCIVQAYRQLSPREARVASTKTDPEGRFDLEFRKSQFLPYRIEPWRFAVVAAFSPDMKFGPAWKNYSSIVDRDKLTLQLVPDEPIEGRIIDLEGKPIAGVDAKVAFLTSDVQNDVNSEEIASKSAIPFAGSQGFEEPDRFLSARLVDGWQTRTDSDGRFHISGVGRDRVAHIDVSGAGIVPTELRVVARPMQTIKDGDARRVQIPESSFIYGSHFRFAAEPSQLVEGTVRDAATGKPLAGVHVLASQLAGAQGSVTYWTMKIGAVSDEAGRYRLDGMPKGPGNQIMAMPADGRPYFMRAFNVPAAPEFRSVKFDLNLHGGRLIHGRVTDARTGDPVSGARMEYVAWPTNPAIKGMPEFDYGWVGLSSNRYQTDRDGRYTLVGLPGRGLVEVGYCPQPFSTGQGLKEIADLPSERELEKVSGRPPDQHFPTAIKNLQIGDGDEEANVDFALDRGKRITLNLVDPDGKPLSGVRIDGLDPNIDLATREDAGPTADVVGLGSDEKRLVLLYQKQRNLGKAIYVGWNENHSGPLTVNLEPCATLHARVLNELHEPVRGGYVILMAQHGAFSLRLPFGKTDDDGRLNYTTLLPGGSYRVICVAHNFHESLVDGELAVAPGEIIDLGEFDAMAKNRPKINRTTMASSQTSPAAPK